MVVWFCKTLKKGPKLGKSSPLWASPEFHQGKLNELSPKLLLKVPFNFPELVQFFLSLELKTVSCSEFSTAGVRVSGRHQAATHRGRNSLHRNCPSNSLGSRADDQGGETKTQSMEWQICGDLLSLSSLWFWGEFSRPFFL